jgi:hypothetical protein
MSHGIETKLVENRRGERRGGFGFRKEENFRVV